MCVCACGGARLTKYGRNDDDDGFESHSCEIAPSGRTEFSFACAFFFPRRFFRKSGISWAFTVRIPAGSGSCVCVLAQAVCPGGRKRPRKERNWVGKDGTKCASCFFPPSVSSELVRRRRRGHSRSEQQWESGVCESALKKKRRKIVAVCVKPQVFRAKVEIDFFRKMWKISL